MNLILVESLLVAWLLVGEPPWMAARYGHYDVWLDARGQLNMKSAGGGYWGVGERLEDGSWGVRWWLRASKEHPSAYGVYFWTPNVLEGRYVMRLAPNAAPTSDRMVRRPRN